jgi:putative cell wall-binding protein
VSAVFIATGESFPDALAMGPAAATLDAPLLLVAPNSIPGPTAAELQRLNPGSIVIGGGVGAVSASVQQQLAAYTSGPVTRISGTNRYSTAAKMSQAYFSPGVGTVYVTTGANFPDALSAGAAAAAGGRNPVPVLLANGSGLPGEVAAELIRLDPNRVVIVGGTGVVSPAVEAQIQGLGVPDVDRIGGSNRYATSAAVAASVFSSGQTSVLLATGQNYPDALAAVALAGKLGAPLLLTEADQLPPVILSELRRLLS